MLTNLGKIFRKMYICKGNVNYLHGVSNTGTRFSLDSDQEC